jgi:hypothetical protein
MGGFKIEEISAFHHPDKNAETVEDRIKAGQEVNSIPSDSGLLHSGTPRKHLTFREAQNNSVIQHYGSYIVLGTDRPSHLGTGMGASGYSNADAIDMVVGRGQTLKNKAATSDEKDKDKNGLPDGYIVGPMFTGDAARIYVSSRTNIDQNFGLAGVPRDPHKDKKDHPLSGIGIKADNVRVIGRNNIKIVTGRNQGFKGGMELNSLAGKSPQAGTISLIGGNYTDPEVKLAGLFQPDGVVQSIPYLQPAIKGDNLVMCLEALFSYCDMLEGAVYNLCLNNLDLKILDISDPFMSPIHSIGAFLSAGMDIPWAVEMLYESRSWSLAKRQDFLSYGGPLHIRSQNVYLT